MANLQILVKADIDFAYIEKTQT